MYILTLSEVLSNLVTRCFLSKNFRGLVYCLVFIVLCFIIFCRFLLSATTSISYHKQLSLSRTFFEKLFDFFFWFFSGGLWLNTGIPSKIKVFRGRRSQRRVIIYHIPKALSTTFFTLFISRFYYLFFLNKHDILVSNTTLRKKWKWPSSLPNGERGIWTLAPVARPTPLAGAPLRPLEYFSELINASI